MLSIFRNPGLASYRCRPLSFTLGVMNSTVLPTSMFSEELVPTEGFYIAVYDEQSPANVLNYLTSGLEAAKVAAR